VSTWLGPPFMNSQMTDFALVGKCAGRGASGCSWRAAGFTPAVLSAAKAPA
jgi:hypothetical protein